MEGHSSIKYPCENCERQESCSYKDCQEYVMWFSQEWKIIQEEARKIKEKKLRRVRW